MVYLYTSALSAQATAALSIMACANNKTTSHESVKTHSIEYKRDISGYLNDLYDSTKKDSIYQTIDNRWGILSHALVKYLL